MKLLLLLVAIYSLIFYQSYKIEKSGLPVSKEVFEKAVSYEYPVLPGEERYPETVPLTKNKYPSPPEYRGRYFRMISFSVFK